MHGVMGLRVSRSQNGAGIDRARIHAWWLKQVCDAYASIGGSRLEDSGHKKGLWLLPVDRSRIVCAQFEASEGGKTKTPSEAEMMPVADPFDLSFLQQSFPPLNHNPSASTFTSACVSESNPSGSLRSGGLGRCAARAATCGRSMFCVYGDVRGG